LDYLSNKFEFHQANDADIEWIAELEKNSYSGIDAIPFAILNEWYQANSNGFFIVKEKNGNRVGHVDILPLRKKTLCQFIDGEIIEQDIRGDSLFAEDEKGEIVDLYIESIAIPYLKGFVRSFAFRDTLLSFDRFVENICVPNQSTTVYAMPASVEGLRVMTKLNFNLLVDGKQRKDGYGMYKIPYFSLKENIRSQF
jgi:hypothetical protein